MSYNITISEVEGANRPIIITDESGNAITQTGLSSANITVDYNATIVKGEKARDSRCREKPRLGQPVRNPIS